jgi:hypothetical protein
MKTLYNSFKTIVILFTGFLLLETLSLYAQAPRYLATPRGTEIPDTYTFEEFHWTTRRDLDNYWRNLHPNAQMLYLWGESYSSSHKYNCHGYAWYMFGDNAINDPV